MAFSSTFIGGINLGNDRLIVRDIEDQGHRTPFFLGIAQKLAYSFVSFRIVVVAIERQTFIILLLARKVCLAPFKIVIYV